MSESNQMRKLPLFRWQRVNDEPFEYGIMQDAHGDEFVKLRDGSCLKRPLVESTGKIMSNYEVLDEMIDEAGDTKLSASWTGNNGIRVALLTHFEEDDMELSCAGKNGWDQCWRSFDFTHEQARKLGEALIR